MGRMNDTFFRKLLILLHCCDEGHWPVQDEGENRMGIAIEVEGEARSRGYENWYEAYKKVCC